MNDIRDKTQITACIDGSGITQSIVDTAAWAARALDAPLLLLHVLEKISTPSVDRSGAIGPGSVSQLLDELTELDEKRGRVAMELGKHMLAAAAARAKEDGVAQISVQQRHDELVDALLTLEEQTRLFVVGRHGVDHEQQPHKLGAQLEPLVRAIHTPTLVAVGAFTAPADFMIAYDGSETTDKAIAGIAGANVLRSLPGHVVMVGADNEHNQRSLQKATAILAANGRNVQAHLVQGNVVDSLMAFRERHNTGLMVMGAYGHSRVREFFLGSNTSNMITRSPVPLLLLR